VRSRDGGLLFGLLELCGEMLTTLDVVFLKMLPARAHAARHLREALHL
jgi:hypothetical protein